VNKLAQQFITFLLAISLVGCFGNKQPKEPKEYAYLAPLVKKEAKWGDAEWNVFIGSLNDKHLIDLALEWGVLNEASQGVNVLWRNKQKIFYVGDDNVNFVLDSLGGRQKTIDRLQNDLKSARFPLPFPFHKGVEWHDIVLWACKEAGTDQTYAHNSFDAELALINRIFEHNWDKLSEAQRKTVIENSALSKLSSHDKDAILVASGTAALGILNTAVGLSGFAFYTTMSSAIAAIANVFGVTLPFVVYTSASTVTGVLTGPVGWTLLAAASTGLVWYALKPDDAKVTRMVVSLHLLKAKALDDSL
jgi:hypothetical protein